MPTLSAFLAYTAACVLLVIVPGPTVTLIIANSLRYGTRAGLLNVAGTQAGLAIMLAVLMAGLSTATLSIQPIFEWLRLAGAAYLVWLGIKLLRSDGKIAEGSERTRPGGSFFWQGFLVILSNPKVLLLFGALIPQFLNPAGDSVRQTAMLGLTFMLVATVFDGLYAVLAGKAGSVLTTTNIRWVERISGTILILGGLWLAYTGIAASKGN